MTKSRWIFWHRRDLRFSNNVGLSQAAKRSKSLVGIYVLDPNIINPEKSYIPISPARIWFLAHSLKELHKSWEEAGSQLIIIEGEPEKIIPCLAKIICAEGVIWNKNAEPYEINRDKEVESSLRKESVKIFSYWDQLLVNPENIKTLHGNPYKVYGHFHKNWEKKLDLEINSQKDLITTIKPRSLTKLNKVELLSLKKSLFGNKIDKPLDTLNDLLYINKFNSDYNCPCKPGESAAKKQLKNFISGSAITQYEFGRDMPFEDATSKLSAALNFGTISCRDTFGAANSSKSNSTETHQIKSINIWIKELAWREFYQNVLFHFPQLANGPYQNKWKHFPWQNNSKWFQSWIDGTTGFPIIDASMRQLKQSGWMHNRCRMIVASFLVKDLLCDWKLGEKAFMKYLVDGDLASNNGGWQWTASTGMDPKPLRIFNPHRQANKFDKEAKYIRYWLPELSHIDNASLITGDILPIERKGYPPPFVSHNTQQKIFRGLYSELTRTSKS